MIPSFSSCGCGLNRLLVLYLHQTLASCAAFLLYCSSRSCPFHPPRILSLRSKPSFFFSAPCFTISGFSNL